MAKKKKEYNEQDGVWRTIGGRRVFIRNGQSLSDAMKESGKFKKTSDVKRGEYQDVEKELKANKTDYLVRQDAKEQGIYTGDTSKLDGKHIDKDQNKGRKESPIEEEKRIKIDEEAEWQKEEDTNKSLSRQYKNKEKENGRLSKGMTKEEYKEGEYSFEKDKETLVRHGLDNSDPEFKRSMLGRMESDIKYYTGNGGGYSGHLWAKDENEHINIMKALYNTLPEKEKPDWINEKSIEEYSKQMDFIKNNKSIKQRYSTMYDYLKNNTLMSESEIIKYLKELEKNKK